MVEQSKSGTNAEIVYDCLGNKLALMKGLTTIDHAFAALPGGGTAVYTGGAGPFYYRHAEWLGSSARERRGRRVPQAAVRAFFVVLLPPRGDLPPRLEQVLKPTRVQTLVARAARFR